MGRVLWSLDLKNPTHTNIRRASFKREAVNGHTTSAFRSEAAAGHEAKTRRPGVSTHRPVRVGSTSQPAAASDFAGSERICLGVVRTSKANGGLNRALWGETMSQAAVQVLLLGENVRACRVAS